MKYLKIFTNESDYQVFKESEEFVLPNVSYTEDTNVVFYHAEKIAPSAPVGASIYGLDGKFYSVEEWTSAGKSSDDAVGVAVSDGDHSFVIHPTAVSDNRISWADDPFVVEGVFVAATPVEAKLDFNGKANTAALIANANNPQAALFCFNTVFANGVNGYLPSAGELFLIYNNKESINILLELIDGVRIPLGEDDPETNIRYGYWSSTQSTDPYSAYHCNGYVDIDEKSVNFCNNSARPVCPITQ